MRPELDSLPRRLAAPALPLLLLLLLLAVNLLAIAGLVTARQGARRSALQDLQLETQGQARLIEAGLAALRHDLVDLARSAALRAPLLSADDQRRAGAFAALEQFLTAHPAVRAMALRDNRGQPLAMAARRGGEIVQLPPASDPPAPIADRSLFVTQFSVPGPNREPGLVEAWIDPSPLLQAAVPGGGGRLMLQPGDEAPPVPGDALRAAAPVGDPLWVPPIAWTLVRTESESRTLASVAALAGRYRFTAVLNVGVMGLTLMLGFLAFQQAQRSSALQAENRQQERMRELERQVLHAERLASVGRMAAGVAHEVNNPLEGTFNYLSLLEEDLAAGDVDRARPLVGKVREGLTRVAAVMRQMLAMSDAGRGEKTPLDLREPLARAVEFVRSHKALREVAIRVDLPAEPVPVDGNAVTLGQLFLNLLLNAGQVQGGRGEVEIACKSVGERAVVRVRDRGPGFSRETQERLFEPFYSTRGSIGLGLAVCAGIVRDHGGTIRGTNRDGGGAEMTVDLPLRRPRPAESPAAAGAGDHRSRS